jgi:hypothetical protein
MEEEEELHSFAYCEIIGGAEHNYRITQNDGKYVIEKDGVVIAKVGPNNRWRQLSGKALNKELLENICDHIEAHYG